MNEVQAIIILALIASCIVFAVFCFQSLMKLPDIQKTCDKCNGSGLVPIQKEMHDKQ